MQNSHWPCPTQAQDAPNSTTEMQELGSGYPIKDLAQVALPQAKVSCNAGRRSSDFLELASGIEGLEGASQLCPSLPKTLPGTEHDQDWQVRPSNKDTARGARL